MSAPRAFATGLTRLSAAAARRLPSCRSHITASAATSTSTSWRQCRVSPVFQSLRTSSVRSFSTTLPARHGHVHKPKEGEELWVTFIDKEGEEHKLAVCAGDNLLDIAQAHDLEMEGACGGSCACSTCHVIVTDEGLYDQMPEPEDDENDMLDLAFGLTETSRLGCQVVMTKELDGLVVKLPTMTRNLQASDFQ
ncbi:mitochondrial matrix iron-sulfur protein [Lecanicillium sp. MT-2017a]|nr:mitochondrial matrix iron-sulfur protein [Lecanicillium sp. MT-2017a]